MITFQKEVQFILRDSVIGLFNLDGHVEGEEQLVFLK